jgi:hypothetical protein
MDRAKFQELLNTHMEWVHKNPKTRKVYKQRAQRGIPVPESTDESKAWEPKPIVKPCEVCDVAVINPRWTIALREIENENRWVKSCQTCKRLLMVHPHKKKRIKKK